METSPATLKNSRILTIVLTVMVLFGSNLPVHAAVIEGKFDAFNGQNVISGDFISSTLSPGSTPSIDPLLQALLLTGGYQYAPLGISFTGETRSCKNGILFGNLYISSDPKLTDFWGVDAIIFMPAGMLCGTGAGDTPFGAGEGIVVLYTGPQVPGGYFSAVDVFMVSGSSDAVDDGLNGMCLSLEPVQ